MDFRGPGGKELRNSFPPGVRGLETAGNVWQRLPSRSCPYRNLYSIPAGCYFIDFHDFHRFSEDLLLSSIHRCWRLACWLAGWLAGLAGCWLYRGSRHPKGILCEFRKSFGVFFAFHFCVSSVGGCFSSVVVPTLSYMFLLVHSLCSLSLVVVLLVCS
jgi:hypothetical protein